jgi:hypothetical protein
MIKQENNKKAERGNVREINEDKRTKQCETNEASKIE